ncbi:hypothetical protein QSV34_05060 [Porticoccus sp. W117]|uniref:hypothetical protein n=1 Tax=Porticoccus sp. W117 TaxID=3054777 RepID=UPI002595A483|nr:hypothetical protein [Porticoccus sp. W117]MDM3870717.1 hypothetical protein [Porticoccus sp. W117]
MAVIEDTSKWADVCFRAVNGRDPNRDLGEAKTIYRDVDLDGVREKLEIRGTGNRLKQIYVFKLAESGYLYTGCLPAHPSFFVAKNMNDEVLILNVFSMGSGHIELQEIKYIDNEYKIVSVARAH